MLLEFCVLQDALGKTFVEYHPAPEELPAAHKGAKKSTAPFYRTHPDVLTEQRLRGEQGELPSKILEDTYCPHKGTTMSARDRKQAKNSKYKAKQDSKGESSSGNVAEEWVSSFLISHRFEISITLRVGFSRRLGCFMQYSNVSKFEKFYFSVSISTSTIKYPHGYNLSPIGQWEKPVQGYFVLQSTFLTLSKNFGNGKLLNLIQSYSK